MKKIKSLAIAALFMSATAVAVTSCGGGEAEEIKQDSGLGVIKFLMSKLEGNLKFDATKKEDIAKVLEMKAEDEYMSGKKEFKDKGYYISQSVSLYEGTLQSISYDSFYDDDKKEAAKKDAEEIKTFLNEKLGKTSESDGENTIWEKDKYSVDFTIYENGWGLYVRSNREVKYPTVEDTGSADCEGKVGDFFGLTNDLSDLLLTNLKSGKISIGKTTETEMAAIFGDAAAYNKEFDGIRVSAYFTYEGVKLSSIRYDYFYDCESAKSLLSTDKTDVKAKVETILGATAKTTGEGDFITYDWDLKSYKVSQSNFSDGYALSINK
jgi:hypothetical protein